MNLLALTNGHIDAANWMFAIGMIAGIIAAVIFWVAPQHKAGHVFTAAAAALIAAGLLAS